MAATRTNQVTIASGATTSISVDTSAFGEAVGLVGFIMPAAFTGASLSFKVSQDDVTYVPLNDSSNALVSITVTASTAYGFKQDVRSCLDPWRFFQFVSASSEAAPRIIVIIVE